MFVETSGVSMTDGVLPATVIVSLLVPITASTRVTCESRSVARMTRVSIPEKAIEIEYCPGGNAEKL